MASPEQQEQQTTSLPLRPALRVTESEEPLSPKTGATKEVVFAEPDEASNPPIEEITRIKKFPTKIASRRLSGRPVMPSNSSSKLSLLSNPSIEDFALPDPSYEAHKTEEHSHKHHEHRAHQHDKLLFQVSEWLQREKAKRAARKSKGRSSKHKDVADSTEVSGLGTTSGTDSGAGSVKERETRPSKPRTHSQGSDSEISLEALQKILEENMSGFSSASSTSLRRPSLTTGGKRRASSIRSHKGGFASSDTEYQDGDVLVPSCDVVLDNSKTMSYTGGTADSAATTVTLNTSRRAEKERLAWVDFKGEIVRLAHTLRLKGWRRVPLDRGGDIKVERLSGALTNAVYVVLPPDDLPLNAANSVHKHKPPPKLLLRIYGPQVEHLIDRENELGILRRLARKKIGPRLLGTFKNGRFEEYFESQTLTAADLRVADTSKAIAKRMRELHDGIELLERERQEGPFVWLNWDKWVARCEEVIGHLDKDVLSGKKTRGDSKVRGLVCGVEWNVFRDAVDKYRKWIDAKYTQKGGVNSSLVFAHNDTQYGNILRLVPAAPTPGTAPSPLLLPQNTHKQLIVIDFEYASANTRGLEFANHFTEWCYNYHEPSKSWACDTNNYPTLEEQRRFVRSYINHRPQFNPRASATPKMSAMDGLAKGSISEFLLDSRTPGTTSPGNLLESYADEEARREKDVERQVEEMLQEIRVWRVANSAQWVAWGIVQAKVPELDSPSPSPSSSSPVTSPSATAASSPPSIPNTGPDPQIEDGNSVQAASTDSLALEKRPEGLKAEALRSGEELSTKEAEVLEEEEDEFDYLAYAQDRARFFWGDLVSMGFVDKKALPSKLVSALKIVDS